AGLVHLVLQIRDLGPDLLLQLAGGDLPTVEGRDHLVGRCRTGGAGRRGGRGGRLGTGAGQGERGERRRGKEPGNVHGEGHLSSNGHRGASRKPAVRLRSSRGSTTR